MNNNDILKNKLRELKAANRSALNLSGTQIAVAGRAQLNEWLIVESIDPDELIRNHKKAAGEFDDESNPAPAPAPAPAMGNDQTAQALEVLRGVFGGGQAASLSASERAQLKAEIIEEVTPQPVTITVETPAKLKIELGAQHCQFPQLLKTMTLGLMPFVTGGAGGGKSTAGEKVAEALELPFYSLSLSSQTGVHALLGYNDANGRYVSTEFRKAFEGGGVFILDEIDNGNANVLAVLNTALANGHCAFADMSVKRHADFRLMATANTVGRGGSAQFVGRNPIDGATLDRFVLIHWEYDEKFEFKLTGNDSWVKRVQAIREAANQLNSKLIVSPRASMHGAKLLANGFTQSEVEEMVIFKGLAKPERDKILSKVS